jgi:uncharacterized repeat protein (TIGR01451 family)
MGWGFEIGADELFVGPRLTIVKEASSDIVQSGGRLTYTLSLSNTGTTTLTATIVDVLPPQVMPTGILTWTPPAILPGNLWTETVVVTVEAGYVGLLTNVIRASAEEGATGVYTHTLTVVSAESEFYLYLPLVLKYP